MKIKGISEAEILEIAKSLNFVFTNVRHEGNYTLGILRMAVNIGRKGWRKAPEEALKYRKRGFQAMCNGSDAFGGNGAVCFHGHKHFMEKIFMKNPNAIIRTTMAAYKGAQDFREKWGRTGATRAGSMMNPYMYQDACDCGPEEMEDRLHEVQFGTLLPPETPGGEARLVDVKTLRSSDIGKCPFLIFVPSHYRTDGTCKCNDAEERAMMKREWDYTDEAFREKGIIA